ncbi:MAG: hypothetical protein PHU61_01560 [Candidatus Absconditabacteria bacterium]|nr:hypothetical protein [Candidatus Absconditabacteria bacterium]MDD3868013.1 hypothetical protein [Candidatus Absconditabacteria bacterium]MDD4714260.1 hypothetical protein [Candidatus Absconditabacteria bacterium]
MAFKDTLQTHTNSFVRGFSVIGILVVIAGLWEVISWDVVWKVVVSVSILAITLVTRRDMQGDERK